MIYTHKAKFMANNVGPEAGRMALLDGAAYYGQKMADAIAPMPTPDIPLVLAAAMATVKTLSAQFPQAVELAENVAEDLYRVSATLFVPDPNAKKRRDEHPPE